jgi:hypothetical protein
MTHQRLGQHEEAATRLREATEAVDYAPATQPIKGRLWKRQLFLKVLSDEAKTLIAPRAR